MKPLQWLFDHVLSERQVAVLSVAIGAVIALQSGAWNLRTGDIITSDKGNEIHYLVLLGQGIRIASLQAFFPYFVGGQALLVLMAVMFRSRLGLALAIVLPLLWICLVEVRGN